jgi:hypothetical protein
MRILVAQAHKSEGLSILHRKALYYLSRCSKTHSGIIRFPEVYRTLSWLLHLNKTEAKEFLKELQRAGVIELIPFNGIRITEVDSDAREG